MTPAQIQSRIHQLRTEIATLEHQLEASTANDLPCLLTLTNDKQVIEQITCPHSQVQANVIRLMDEKKLITYAFYGYPLNPADETPLWWDAETALEPVYISRDAQTILLAVAKHGFGPVYGFSVKLA